MIRSCSFQTSQSAPASLCPAANLVQILVLDAFRRLGKEPNIGSFEVANCPNARDRNKLLKWVGFQSGLQGDHKGGKVERRQPKIGAEPVIGSDISHGQM